MNLSQLKLLFSDAGAVRVLVKQLAPNDNSKNQVYFGPDFLVLNLLPNRGIRAETERREPIFKAPLHFSWIQPSGATFEAPGAQLILYPQYPEVRFSGFLRSCKNAPSDIMASREPGRLLFLGLTGDRRIIGLAVSGASEIAKEFTALALTTPTGIFHDLQLPNIAGATESRQRLLNELRRIARLGWINSKQLSSDGSLKDCNAPQCGGFTLEAELGISKNSRSEPDYLGWEVKQYAVTSLNRIESAKPITLMTPEPDGGFYADNNVADFIRKYGYKDKNGILDRLNFGGRHKVGIKCPATGLTMKLHGFDTSRGCIIAAGGAIALETDHGEVAASWSFRKVLEHWSKKHAKAAYVPSTLRTGTRRQYMFGQQVRLAENTDALKLLKAMSVGAVYYDPGIKLENASTANPTNKKRSQFRVASRQIEELYETVELVNL